MYEIVPLFAFLVILLYISIEDIKYRMIPYWTVPILFAIAPIYIYLADLSFTKASFSFMMVACLFLFLFIVGKGSFGIGDVMVMAVIGWVLGDISNAYVYLIYIFAPIWLIWYIINIVDQSRKYGFKWKELFKYRKSISTSELKPGMVMANDNFMHGLTPKDIEEVQKRYDEVTVKLPLAFCPIACIATILFFILLYAQPSLV